MNSLRVIQKHIDTLIKMAKKIKRQQLEVKWETAEPFALQIQTAKDGDKITAQAEQLAADRELSETLQHYMNV